MSILAGKKGGGARLPWFRFLCFKSCCICIYFLATYSLDRLNCSGAFIGVKYLTLIKFFPGLSLPDEDTVVHPKEYSVVVNEGEPRGKY